MIKTQLNWTEEDWNRIRERLPYWKANNATGNNEMLAKVLQLLVTGDGDEALLQELDSSIEINYEKLMGNVQSISKEMHETVQRLDTILARQKDDEYTRFMVEFLAPLEAENTKSQATMKSHYFASLIKLISNNGRLKDPLAAINALLQDNETNVLHLSVAAEICRIINLENNLTEQLIGSLESYKGPEDLIVPIQRVLTENLLSQSQSWNDDSDDVTLEIDNLIFITRFMTHNQSEYRYNQLVLRGLLYLKNNGKISHFISKHLAAAGNFESKKLAIVSFIFSSSSSSAESFYLKRWMQTRSSQEDKGVKAIYNLIERSSANKPNRFWSWTDDIWTADEAKYVEFLGQEETTRLLEDETPVRYLLLLKTRAVESIREQIQAHYKSEQDEESWHKFNEQFNFSFRAAVREGIDFDWIVWLKNVVIKSLPSESSGRFPLASLGQLLMAIVLQVCSFHQLKRITLISRPHQWLDKLLVNFIVEWTGEEPDSSRQLTLNLFIFLNRCIGSRRLLHILCGQMRNPSEALVERNDQDVQSLIQMLNNLKSLKDTLTDDVIDRFRRLPISCWSKRIRHLCLSQTWSPSLADRLIKIDNQLGATKVDQLLENFHQHCPEDVDTIVQNLIQYPWLTEEIDDLQQANGNNMEVLLNFLKNKDEIRSYQKSNHSNDLNYVKIIGILKRNDSKLDDDRLLDQMSRIVQLRQEKKASQVESWLEDVKSGKSQLELTEFLSLASVVIENLDRYYPRDTQLVAVLVLADSSDHQISCMAEIATGEGKTLITALLAIYLSLSGKGVDEKTRSGCVNVVTSSSVLAEENVKVVQKLFDKFDVSVGNNCDMECSDDEEKRRERYKNDVIYGDLSSFQRDELISRFFGRDVNRNRQADAVIVDEVCFKFYFPFIPFTFII